MKKILILALILSLIKIGAQEIVIKGVVSDAQNNETLPIVNIAINGDPFRGNYSDPQGAFEVKVKPSDKFLAFTYIGYETFKLDLKKTKQDFYQIKMQPTQLSLGEVVIKPSENPANRIINNVVKYKAINATKNIKAYKSKVYNKMKIRVEADTSKSNKSLLRHFYNAYENYFMYISESISERFSREGEVKNVVIANKVAGYELPEFNFSFDALQPFDFYDDNISLYNKNYLSPLTKGSPKFYSFLIKDTVTLDDGRVSYVIDFKPRGDVQAFNGLHGTLHIDTATYGISKVIAEPKLKELVYVKIDHTYQYVDNKQWFPKAVKFQLFWDKFPDKYASTIIYGETYPSDIDLNPRLDSVKFNEYAIEYAAMANKKLDSNYWNKARVQGLEKIEVESYNKIDQLNKKYHVEEVTNAVGKMLTGFYLPIGYANIDLTKLYYFNNYEGHRFGFGAWTGSWLMKNLEFGGYGVYGTRDEKWKFGSHLAFIFDRKSDFKFKIQYRNDLEQPTRNYIYFDRAFSNIDDIVITRYNPCEEFRFDIGSRIKYIRLNLGFRHQSINPQWDYEKRISNEPSQMFSEFELNFKYAYKEKVLPIFGEELYVSSKLPRLYINFKQGVKGLWGGEYSYSRINFALQRIFEIVRYGQTAVQLEAGYVYGKDLPYHKAFSGRGSNAGFTFLILNSFQTMYQDEFAMNKYANLFIRHTFEPINFKTQYIKPRLAIMHNMGIGYLDDDIKAKYPKAEDLHNVYLESGIGVSNIARVNIYSFGYFGVGFTTSYRYGAHSLGPFKDNFSFKIGFAFSL